MSFDSYDRRPGGGRGRGRGGPRPGRGGGWGRRDDADPAAREAAWLARYRRIVLNLGEPEDFHAPSEMYAVASELVDGFAAAPDIVGETVSKAVLAAVIEQPHKHPLCLALLAVLAYTPPPPRREGAVLEDPALKLHEEIVGTMLRAFRSFLDRRLWRSVRLQVRFFALLAGIGLLQRASVLALLSAFAAVLDEPAVTAARSDWASEVIIESLLFAGPQLAFTSDDEGMGAADLDPLVDAVLKYAAARRVSQELVAPFTSGADVPHLTTEGFASKVSALEAMRAARYPRLGFLPSVTDLVPPDTASRLPLAPVDTGSAVPETLIPPETDTEEMALHDDPVEDLRADPHAGRVEANPMARAEQVTRSGKGPYGGKMLLLRWMDGTTPAVGSVASVVLRSILDDLVDLYEPNRREAARVLVNLPHWLPKELFGGRTDPEIGMTPAPAWDAIPESQLAPIWGLSGATSLSPFVLEDLVVECLLSMAMLLPIPPYPVLYYATLLREIVSLAPGTVAPALGKTLRRLYSAFSTGQVEPEIILRTAAWFSVHLSNFNYGWAWGEWVPAMEQPAGEPRRTLVTNLVQEIVRLAYYDRIKSLLPPALAEGALPDHEPAGVFDYASADEGGDPSKEKLVIPANKVLAVLKTKAPSEDVRELLGRLGSSLLAAPGDELEVEPEFLLATTDEVTGENTTRPLGGASTPEEADQIVGTLALSCLLLLGSRSFSHLLNIVERYHPLLRALSETEGMRVALLAAALRFWREHDEWAAIVVDKLLQYRIVEPNDVLTLLFSNADGEQRTWARALWGQLAMLATEKAAARVAQLRVRPASEEEEPRRLQALENVEKEHRRVLVTLVQGLGTSVDTPSSEGEWESYWRLGWYKLLLRRFHSELQGQSETVQAALADGRAKELLQQACFLGNE